MVDNKLHNMNDLCAFKPKIEHMWLIQYILGRLKHVFALGSVNVLK